MKKLLFVALLALLFVPNADAYQCVRSQAIDKSDQCVTSIRVASDEATLVSEGHVLVYDLSQSTDELKSFVTELADASVEGLYVAGIATDGIVSDSVANVVVRGKTKVKLASAVEAGEALYASASEGKLGTTGDGVSRPVGFALEAGAANADIDAYITIV